MAGSWQKTGLEEIVNEVGLESCDCPGGSLWLLIYLCFLAFVKRGTWRHQGKERVRCLAVNSEFHGSLAGVNSRVLLR